MKRCFYILFLQLLFISLKSQQSNSNFGRNYSIFKESQSHVIDNSLHTSVKPYLLSNIDSNLSESNSNWFDRKLNNEYFIQYENKDYSLILNPILDLEVGKEFNSNTIYWKNTRGIIADGKLGNKFSFYSLFLENQSRLPSYVTNTILSKSAWVIPGQGESRWSQDTIFDYAMAEGHLTYQFSSFSSFQFGTGKNFIGDGYRSMILSDNAFNYPFLRIHTKAGIFQYTNLYMQHIDMMSNPSQEYTYDRKYMTLHHLSTNLTNRLNIGIFESVIWSNQRTPEVSGFDIAYLNPIIFLRPVEFSINSSDNVLIGSNLKFKLTNNAHIYAQFIIDEFSLPELTAGNSWWGNKYAYQIGGKSYNSFNIDNFNFQFEHNFARPYMYSHNYVNQNYGHFYQPLSHPLGANFRESLLFIDYKYKKWEVHLQILTARFGDKIKNDSISYGNDIFISNSYRPSDFDIQLFQGNDSRLNYYRLYLSYLLNPRTNLKIESGYIFRKLNDDQIENKTGFIFFALRSDLFNRYYDF